MLLLHGNGRRLFLQFLTLFLNCGIAPGSDGLKASGEPVLEGYRTIFGEGVGARILGLVAVAGGSAGVAAVAFAVGFSEAAFVGLLARLGGSVAAG